MTTKYTREDDLVVALQEATKLMSSGGRFDDLARCLEGGDRAAAKRVTAVADEFVAWLRRVARVTGVLVAIEEIDNPAVSHTPEGASVTTNINTSERARWVLTAEDKRGYEIPDAPLGARSSDGEVATAEIVEATVSASGHDELLVTFAGKLGTTTAEVFSADDPSVVLFAEVVVANPGAVAAVSPGEAVIEEISAPEASVEPAPGE